MATATRPITVTTPQHKDVLLLRHMTASEELGRLSEFELDLLSTDTKIKLEDMIGKPMTVALDLPNGKERYLSGLVTRFAQSGRIGRYTQYTATVRPWLWLLTRTTDCRIFPDNADSESITVPDLIKKVFRANGFSDFKERLNGTYKAREFCVQYRESDFDFISRLMEEEGIYYYFTHEDGKHTLVIADSPNAHDPIPGSEQVPYMAASAESAASVDHITEWEVAHELQTGQVVLNDYDFETPRADLKTTSSVSRSHAHAKLEAYDYPGEYVGARSARGEGTSGDDASHDRGQHFARVEVEALHADYEVIEGEGNVRGLAVGGTFKLTGFNREDQLNRDYLVTSTDFEVQVNGVEGLETNGGDTVFRMEFTAIPAKTPFRSEQITEVPDIGTQTATVVGKSGEEIWTDVHGRVKVQFHWDRRAAHDETSSCWVRVASPWAGKGWGAVHIPRIGQEVVVEFLEGNPDRPIIIGSVYNGQNPVPYKLPANQTQSGIKSRSTKTGTPEHFNEIRFEDKKDAEELVIHAQKDQHISVENDETHDVGHDRTKTIGNDETTHVKANRTETVDKDESITISGSRTESVKKDESISIAGGRTETVDKDETITIKGGRTESVTKDEGVTITGERTHSIGKNESLTVGKDQSITVSGGRAADITKDDRLTVSQGRTQTISKDDTLDVGKKLSIVAGDEITLETGSAKIVLKKGGDIQIEGSKITIKASGDLVLKGSKIAQN